MATLNLTGQQAEYDLVKANLQRFKTRLQEREAVFGRLPFEKKKKWVQSGKDPIMTAAFQMWQYLDSTFFQEARDNI